jgi:hypothetical protein
MPVEDNAGSVPPPVPDDADRVRAHTSPEILTRLDRQLADRLRQLADQGPAAQSRRLAELDRESDIERYLAANASVLALTGVLLGARVSRRWLVLPVVVLSFLLLHAVQGWCPPVSVFRRMGVRTRTEIDAERIAVKTLRGDLPPQTTADPTERADQVLRAVRS